MNNEIPYITLANGARMPQVGYGVFQLTDYDECRACVYDAIRQGYRLIDTASAYFNEEAIGDAVQQAVSEGLVQRSDLFITTKVWIQDYSRQGVRSSIEQSLAKLKTDYLDLVLLHQPYGSWQQAYQALEEIYREGISHSIGVSNFNQEKMTQLLSSANIRPMVNQIEIHPFFSEKGYTRWLLQQNIQPQAWGPLNEGQRGIFTHPLLTNIGKKYGKTAAQIALRWNIQQGNAVIPKSRRHDHRAENIDLFDFQLNKQEMEQIDQLDEGYSEIIDLDNPASERLFLKWKIHE